MHATCRAWAYSPAPWNWKDEVWSSSRSSCASLFAYQATACTRDEVVTSQKTPFTRDYFNHRNVTSPPRSIPPTPHSAPVASPASTAVNSSSASWPNLAAFFNTAVFQRTPPVPAEPIGKRHRTVSVRSEMEEARHPRNRRTSSEATVQQDSGRRLSRSALSRGLGGSAPAVSFGPTHVIGPRMSALSPHRVAKRNAINVSISKTESYG
jgi:hypothetical protein